MTSTVLAQITDELSTNLTSDRELHLIKSAHLLVSKNLSINVLTDRNDVIFYSHVGKVINSFVNNQSIPVGAISLIKKGLPVYVDNLPMESIKAMVEMFLLMVRDSSTEIAYDAFAALEELVRSGTKKLKEFTPGNYLKTKFGANTPDMEEVNNSTEFVDPLVNSDLYEQLQETKPPKKVDLDLEPIEKLVIDVEPSSLNYIAAFLGKIFLLTGSGNLLKTDTQSKDSMKILAIRVLNVICSKEPLEKFVVQIGEKFQHLLDIIEFSSSPDDQLSQQSIKFAFSVLKRGAVIKDIVKTFELVKNHRHLLDAVTSDHIKHLENSHLMDFLDIIALRPLLILQPDINLQDLTSSCRFIGVIKEWIVNNKKYDSKRARKVEEFNEYLQRCIMDHWDSPRFASTITTLLDSYNVKVPLEDQYPPSLPLRRKNVPRTRMEPTRPADYFGPTVYDDWRALIMAEAVMPSAVKIMELFREKQHGPYYSNEKLPRFRKLFWNPDTLPAVMKLLSYSLADFSNISDSRIGCEFGLTVLNWIYRNLQNETGNIQYLEFWRHSLDDSLGNRAEFRATICAFYTSVKSSADEKLDQLITSTVNLVVALLSQDDLSTEHVLEIILYIKGLFFLSPVSAVKLLHALLRSLLDPKLVESLTTEKVLHYQNAPNRSIIDDDAIVADLKYSGEKAFSRWGDDVEVEKVKIGAMTPLILEKLEPLITQSLKVFRYRGKEEKEQVLQMMICLMNHKLKLSDADPTECLMNFTVESFEKPDECAHPELFETLMHFLATASRFQKEETYKKPITAAANLLRFVEILPPEHLKSTMKAVSFALMNGRHTSSDLSRILTTRFSTWMLCVKHAPTETLYALSLLLDKTESGIKNQEEFWSVFLEWANSSFESAVQVPFRAIAYPLSLITDYLTNQVHVFKVIDFWVESDANVNMNAKSGLIATLYFCAPDKASVECWKKYFEYIWKYAKDLKATHLLSKEELFGKVSADDALFDEELTDSGDDRLLEELLDKNNCGCYQDLCHTIVCLGEGAVLEFVNILEKEQPDDDAIWGLLVSEFRRLEGELEHRLDITYRLQDLAESMLKQFEPRMFLKLLANVSNAGVHLDGLKITHVQLLIDQVTSTCSEDGFILRGIRTLLASPHMLQLISEEELGTAHIFVELAEKLTGIPANDTLISSYRKYRVDFTVKDDMEASKVKQIKKFAFSMFALCQEANRRSVKGFTNTQSACFRHPVLNTIFNIPLVAMECFNWVPVLEIKRKPTITCLPPTGHICDVIVLRDMETRLEKVGLVTNAQFEVLFTTMQAVIASTVIGAAEKSKHGVKDVQEREARSCKALQLYITTILTSMKYPNGGDPLAGFVLKSSDTSELFLQSSEFAHLCNLKSVWKCDPRTAFTTPLERFETKTWTEFDGKTSLYGICQTPLFSLWQLCGMVPLESKQSAKYHRVDHSASNYFLTSATNIDTISNLKQLMNIFEYWYSLGVGELSEQLLYSILHTVLHLSDFFNDPELHKAVLRTTSIIFKQSLDQNPFLSSFVIVMFLKSISVLGADMNSLEFKQGEPEAIALKLVSYGLADDSKAVRIHTLAGLLYLVQSDSFESFAPAIDILSTYLEKCLKSLANGSGHIDSDQVQFVIALTIKLLEAPLRLKQDKQTLLMLLLASIRVRRERVIIELIAEGIEQLLCRSNEFNGTVTNFLLAGIESQDLTPFPTDNEYYCRVAYRILMVAATRAKVDKDGIGMTRIYKALQKLGFEHLSRGESAPAITRTLPFFSICVNGVENTIIRYTEAFIANGNDKDSRFITSLVNQIVDTVATSKKWSIELKNFREKIVSKNEPLDSQDTWLLKVLNSKIVN
uniref:Uncharacterized protein n=1 Tax=Caenorhabditis japonica TaxID=281687 RepID=A0A8R1HZ58_CAEJA